MAHAQRDFEDVHLIDMPALNRFYVVLLAAGLMAACGNDPQGVRFLNGGSSSKPQAEPIRSLTADEIRGAILGKTFQYTRSDGNGFITYGADGT